MSPLQIALAAISYGVTVLALTLLTVRVRLLLATYKKGQADPTRSNNKGARLANMLKEVLGHTKMLNFTATGFAHWFVMVGFIGIRRLKSFDRQHPNLRVGPLWLANPGR